MKKIVIGSRGSELALWQTNWMKKQLEDLYSGIQISIEIIKTEGDKILDTALSKIGDKGLFTKAIEEALLEGRIDLAVHSLKDLPTALPGGLCLGAFSRREDARDVFVSLKYDSLSALPQGAAVATGSLRRKCQLLNYRSDLLVSDIRGNVNTRLRKLEANDLDGMILAYAGLKRLGLAEYVKEIIPEEVILPAVGQGVIAAEVRSDDNELLNMLKPLNNKESEYQVSAERSMLKTVEGGCQIPVGVFTKIEGDTIHLAAMIGSVDGKQIVRCSMNDNIENSEELGKRAGLDLLSGGGREILAEIR